MTMPENNAVGSAAEKSDTQTAETCVVCGRLLIPRGRNGECLRCLGRFAFAPESEPSMQTPPSYAHFEVELGADGHPVELGAEQWQSPIAHEIQSSNAQSPSR
jgi:hypothetical protein